MPLPWKKGNKAKAISKFVVDRIQSSKHGGGAGSSSLVVETGFPTSIVDLFVKHRDRLKKPPSSDINKTSKKKKNSKSSRNASPDPISTTTDSSASGGDGDVAPPPSSAPPLLLVSPPDSRTPTNNFLLLPPPPPSHVPTTAAAIAPPSVRGGDDGIARSGNCGGDEIDSTTLFMAMLKMFLVVVLALATTKFVVGITMSAFLLVLIEYAGKHYCRFFKTKPHSPSLCFDKYSLKCFMERAFSFLGINTTNNKKSPSSTDDHQDHDDHADFKAPPSQQQQQQHQQEEDEPLIIITREYNSDRDIVHSHEIEVAAPPISSSRSHHHPPRPPRRIHSVASEPDLLNAQLNWANQQVEDRNLDKEAAYASCDGLESSDVKKRASRRGRIKSRIKRLMSSNLHGSKKKRSESPGNKACYSSGEDDNMVVVNTKSFNRIMDVVEANRLPGTDDCLLSSSTSENGIISFSNEISRADTEDASATSIALTREEEEEEQPKSKTEGNSGYLIFVATTLAGLVGGMGLAIAFTLTFCLLLKSCGVLIERWP